MSNNITQKKVRKTWAETQKEIESMLKEAKSLHHGFKEKIYGDDNGKDNDGNYAIFTDIENSYKKVLNLYEELFVGTEETPSKEKEINSFLQIAKDSSGDAAIELKNISELKQSADTYKKESENIKSAIEGFKNDCENLLREVNGFKDKVLEIKDLAESSKNDHESFTEKLSKIEEETAKQQKINSNIQKQSQALLNMNTDQVMIKTFKDQANHKQAAYYILFSLSLVCAIVMFFIIFAGDLHLKDTQTLIKKAAILPLVFIYFELIKQSSISKRLAEEYQHKASLSEYLVGYKKMWELGRDDEEYINLVEEVKGHILVNPSHSVGIDKGYTEHMKDVIGRINPIKQNKKNSLSETSQ